MIANFGFGVGSMLIFGLVTTMLTEILHRKSSAGVALNNFVRNIFSCVGTVVTSPIISGIGNGWLFTILALVSFISGVSVLLLMKRYGPRWRERVIDH
jgi:MFS family permease